MNDGTASELLPVLPAAESWRDSCMPAMIEAQGPAARFAWEEFFRGEIRNEYTRRNYLHAVRRFLTWTEERGIELTRVAPAHVGAYLDASTHSPPTQKLHLAAIRSFFDRLVVRHVVVLNPAQSVRGPKHATVEGRTPEIGPTQVRQLLDSISPADVVACRDRALVATLVYTAARVGAVVRLRMRDLLRDEATWSVRFQEKGGKQREIPVREDLRQLLSGYLALANAATWSADAPLFRAAKGKTKSLSDRPLTPGDACRMLKRRFRHAKLPLRLSPHSFRVAVITDLLQHGASLEDVQNLAGHADPRTTRLYDRRQRQVTRNVVERITI